MTEQQEQMIYDEGRRRGFNDGYHACKDELAENVMERIEKDGTLVIGVKDATAVARVLVEDSEKNGDLYYADRPSGEWTIRFVKVDNGMGGTYRERRWYCSACSGWQTYGETDFCPNCGADMRGDNNE